MALGMMGLFSVLVLLGVGTSALRPTVNGQLGIPVEFTAGSLGLAIQALIGTVSGFLLFFAIYYVVPNRQQPPRAVMAGALFSGIAFEALTLLFPAYIHLNPNINQYGRNLALLFVLLAFFYALGLITMLGAEINSRLHPELARPAPDAADCANSRRPVLGPASAC
jgi:YihY family inner membrane protein